MLTSESIEPPPRAPRHQAARPASQLSPAVLARCIALSITPVLNPKARAVSRTVRPSTRLGPKRPSSSPSQR